jgi:hypothetical protein
MKNLYKKMHNFIEKNKIAIITGMLAFVFGYGFYYITHKPYDTNENYRHMSRKEYKDSYRKGSYYVLTNASSTQRMASTTTIKNPIQNPEKFSGFLKEVNTGCFSDGECYVVVSDKGVLKHITVTLGWAQEVIGKIVGSESIGDLEKFIGKNINVYVNKLDSDNYTLYGDANYYVNVTQK